MIVQLQDMNAIGVVNADRIGYWKIFALLAINVLSMDAVLVGIALGVVSISIHLPRNAIDVKSVPAAAGVGRVQAVPIE